MEPYVYRPLLPAPNSIRLVQLLPGAPGTDIRCQIINYTIRDDQVSGLFEALSYVWGDPKETCRIFVSDAQASAPSGGAEKFLDITTNLYAALQRLRDPALPRLMWVDAICINQGDLAERADQVSFMAKIYSHASCVVVWLGPEADLSAELFATIQDTSVTLVTTPRTMHDLIEESQSIRTLLQQSLKALLDRPWFDRVWVLQEVAASRRVTIVCGDSEITGATFAKSLDQFCESSLLEDRGRRVSASISMLILWHSPTSYQTASNRFLNRSWTSDTIQKWSLADLLERFHLHQASDPRDKVFALLGMSDDADSTTEPIQPNYSMGWDVLFQNLIRNILGSRTAITTWKDRLQACITASACILGTVKSVSGNVVYIWSVCQSVWHSCGKQIHWSAEWELGPYCKTIEEGDLLFLVDGAQQPSILRMCEDHFDIIVISIPQPSRFMGVINKAVITWQELPKFTSYDRLQATMVWDWQAEVDQDSESHQELLSPATTLNVVHPSYSVRLLASAYLFSNRFERTKLSQLLTGKQNFDSEPKAQKNLETLRLVCFHWSKYIWLRVLVAQLQACRDLILQGSEGRFVHDIDYWQSSKSLCWDLIDTTNLSTVVHPSSGPVVMSEDLISMVFREPGENELFSMILSNCHVKGWPQKTVSYGRPGKITPILIWHVLGHAGVKASDFRMSHTDLLARLSSAEVQRSKEEDMQDVLQWSLILAQGNVLSIKSSELKHVMWQQRTLAVFDLLLAMSLGDVSTAYYILVWIIEHEPLAREDAYQQMVLAPSTSQKNVGSSEVPGYLYSGSSSYEPSDRISDGQRSYPRRWHFHYDLKNIRIKFIDENVEALLLYIENTNLVEFAAATKDDILLPYLLRTFCPQKNHDIVKLDLESVRVDLLQAMIDFRKLHEWNCPPSSDSFQKSPTSGT